jgi:hypothetical protein
VPDRAADLAFGACAVLVSTGLSRQLTARTLEIALEDRAVELLDRKHRVGKNRRLPS